MCCGPRCGYGHYPWHHAPRLGYPWPLMSVEDEVKELEEYKEALEKQLEKINKRLQALKK